MPTLKLSVAFVWLIDALASHPPKISCPRYHYWNLIPKKAFQILSTVPLWSHSKHVSCFLPGSLLQFLINSPCILLVKDLDPIREGNMPDSSICIPEDKCIRCYRSPKSCLPSMLPQSIPHMGCLLKLGPLLGIGSERAGKRK